MPAQGSDHVAKPVPGYYGSAKECKRIFLSHSSTDKKFAGLLDKRLRQFGLTVWFDKAEIKPGDSLSEKIRDAIGEVDVICVILSPEAAVSEWVAKEIRLARRRYRQLNDIKVIPLIYRKTKIPRGLSDRLFIDFSNEAKFEAALGQLLETLGVFSLAPQPSTEELDIRLRQLSSGYPLLRSLVEEADTTGLSVAATQSLGRSAIPPSLIDLFLLLLAMRYSGFVRFGVALTAIDLVNKIGVGGSALEYCLTGDRLEPGERESVANAFGRQTTDPDTLVYLHNVFVKHFADDARYHYFFKDHFDVFRSQCYDEVRSYLLIPNRGPGSLNWDTFYVILRNDPDATDFKRRITDWIQDGEFEKPENRVAAPLYAYLNRIEEDGIKHLQFLSESMIGRVRSLLNSSSIGGAIYHVSAMCEKSYVHLPQVMSLLKERSYSAEASQWPEKGRKLISLFITYIEIILSKEQDEEQARLVRREIMETIGNDGKYQTVWS